MGLSAIYLVFFQQQRLKTISFECLADDEEAFYKSEDSGSVLVDLTISVKNKSTGKELFSFKVDNIYRTVPRLELHRCGIYTIRFLNYDREKTKQDTNFMVEIWRYQYDGEGKSLLSLSEGNDLYYSYVFRINPSENYLALTKGYLGKENYALVIKDLKTLEDVFTLSIGEIEKKNPNIIGNIGLKDWSRDGRYFWADTADGANELSFIRIDSQDWSVDLFPAPKDVLGGDALNLENGYITVHPGNVWFGFADLTEEEKTKRREQGIGTELYIENLFTGKRYLVDKTNEPLWYFKPKWISDTELEYELPTGEKKIYSIEEK